VSANTEKQADKAEDADGRETEMVLVPRRATKEMLEAAYWEINDEDGPAIWGKMVETYLAGQKRKL
jgi:hypothetical protein